ncbi:hypothetical protein ACROYT_G000177 [Oculina patagonica]
MVRSARDQSPRRHSSLDHGDTQASPPRIPEFKQALALCCLGREAATNDDGDERENNATAGVTPVTQLRTLQTNSSHINLAFELEVMDTTETVIN